MKNIASTGVLCILAFTGSFSAVRGWLDVSETPAPRVQHEVLTELHPSKERGELASESIVWTNPVVISAPSRTTERKVECHVRDLVQGSGQVRICEKVDR